MKITRYGQSCVLIETREKRILIDPGSYLYQDSLLEKDWADIDVLLITHKHGDHCLPEAVREIVRNSQTKFYSIQEVKDAYPELNPQITKEGEILEFDQIKIEVTKSVHGYITSFKGDKEINENVGFLIDDGEQKVYVVGDSLSFKNDYQCDVIIIPICNHGFVMGPFDAALFAKETGAGLVIPNHYDSPKHPGDFDLVKEEFNKQGLNYKILDYKESIEV